jgi:hypothetical protein
MKGHEHNIKRMQNKKDSHKEKHISHEIDNIDVSAKVCIIIGGGKKHYYKIHKPHAHELLVYLLEHLVVNGVVFNGELQRTQTEIEGGEEQHSEDKRCKCHVRVDVAQDTEIKCHVQLSLV